MDAIFAAKTSGSWFNPYSETAPQEVPWDLKRALQQNIRAWQNFNRFSTSYRNIYISGVESAKKEDARQKRISEIVDTSMANKKP